MYVCLPQWLLELEKDRARSASGTVHLTIFLLCVLCVVFVSDIRTCLIIADAMPVRQNQNNIYEQLQPPKPFQQILPTSQIPMECHGCA